MRRRSKHVMTLLIGSALPLALTGCDDSESLRIYPDVAACVSDLGQEEEAACRKAEQEAQTRHLQEGPKFPSLESCEQVVGIGSCQGLPAGMFDTSTLLSSGLATAAGVAVGTIFIPRLAGFLLGAMQPQQRQTSYYGGGFGGYPVFIGNDGFARSGREVLTQIPGGRDTLAQGRTSVIPPSGGSSRTGAVFTSNAPRGGGFGASAAHFGGSSGS
jgi:uncharacterized protein YgiB involved in biofilm formation